MNHVCGHPNCQEFEDYMLISIDNGKELIRLCPNHVTERVIKEASGETFDVQTEPSMMEEDETIVCELCDETSEQQENEQMYVYRTLKKVNQVLELHLCQTHLDRLLTRTLTPSDVLKLREKYGNFHEIHHDFYDQKGYAQQPLEVM